MVSGSVVRRSRCKPGSMRRVRPLVGGMALTLRYSSKCRLRPLSVYSIVFCKTRVKLERRLRHPITSHHRNVERKGGIMRFYEGDHAYEVEPIRDPSTQLRIGWRYKVYRIRPDDQLLQSGEAPTQEEAESAGRKALGRVSKAERKGENPEDERAA